MNWTTNKLEITICLRHLVKYVIIKTCFFRLYIYNFIINTWWIYWLFITLPTITIAFYLLSNYTNIFSHLRKHFFVSHYTVLIPELLQLYPLPVHSLVTSSDMFFLFLSSVGRSPTGELLHNVEPNSSSTSPEEEPLGPLIEETALFCNSYLCFPFNLHLCYIYYDQLYIICDNLQLV